MNLQGEFNVQKSQELAKIYGPSPALPTPERTNVKVPPLKDIVKMAKIHVTAKRDFLESLTTSSPFTALSELVWNGFDAGANRVEIFFDLNGLDTIQAIRVCDDGSGIDHSHVEALFGSLGESWKKNAIRSHGRSIHGKNGKGRFKAFSLGNFVEWNTRYSHNGSTLAYKISGKTDALDDFDVSEPSNDNRNRSAGTEVIVNNLTRNFRSFHADSAPFELAKFFAVYLAEYPGISLVLDGTVIDPLAVQNDRSDYHLGDIQLDAGRKTTLSVAIVEWKIAVERAIHLCDASGISLHELGVGPQIRAPGFNFTAYVKSDHFRELDKQNSLTLAEIHPDVQIILNAAKVKIKEHFRQRIMEHQGHVIQRWKDEHIYPYQEVQTFDPVKEAERQVFDILAFNVQSYLPSFEDSDIKSKKFTFQLLAQAIRENPDSVQEIIGEVLGLKKEDQDDLAALLKKTPLTAFIRTAKIVTNRLDFLIGLENLLFDKGSKKVLLERDQLHKILENEAWLFHEEFALAGSEQRLEEVLKKHLATLGKREDESDPVEVGEGKRGRVDLLLHKAIQPRVGEYDYLVVELKRPSQKVNSEVLNQIENYASAVARDERFHEVPTRWTFLVVSNELDDFAKRKANQRHQPPGKVYDDSLMNITVWARSWADVINDARARLHFINSQLLYEADRDSAKDYLTRAHAKFIPTQG